MSENIIVQQAPPTCTDPNNNCTECCEVVTGTLQRSVFGYESENLTCECHDICVEDVKVISAQTRTVSHCIACTVAGNAGCRGAFIPDGPPTIQSVRVRCAEACLGSTCDRVFNEVEFEVILQFGNTNVVVTPRDDFQVLWNIFNRFPSGIKVESQAAFRELLTQIDGVCKVIIIRDVTIRVTDNDCFVDIEYTVIDKLWKHENLLVSAITPYYDPDEDVTNVTISHEFGGSHAIGPCSGGQCS